MVTLADTASDHTLVAQLLQRVVVRLLKLLWMKGME